MCRPNVKFASIAIDDKAVNVRNKLSWEVRGGISTEMLTGNWLKFASSIGLALCLLSEVTAQPVTQDGSTQPSAEDAAGDPAPYIDTSQFLPIQNAMERIAGTLEAQNNSPRSEEETEQARSDLEAQENMAFWAFWMVVAAGAGTLFTAIGLLLIWRTVIYTRDAAGSAKDAVEEAKNATAAARDAVDETRRIGEAQVRCYVSVDQTASGGASIGKPLIVRLHAHNAGQTPATNFTYRGLVRFDPDMLVSDLFSELDRTEWGIPIRQVGTGEPAEIKVRSTDTLDGPSIDAMVTFDADVGCCGFEVRYSDVFGNVTTRRFFGKFSLMAGIRQGMGENAPVGHSIGTMNVEELEYQT